MWDYNEANTQSYNASFKSFDFQAGLFKILMFLPHDVIHSNMLHGNNPSNLIWQMEAYYPAKVDTVAFENGARFCIHMFYKYYQN